MNNQALGNQVWWPPYNQDIISSLDSKKGKIFHSQRRHYLSVCSIGELEQEICSKVELWNFVVSLKRYRIHRRDRKLTMYNDMLNKLRNLYMEGLCDSNDNSKVKSQRLSQIIRVEEGLFKFKFGCSRLIGFSRFPLHRNLKLHVVNIQNKLFDLRMKRIWSPSLRRIVKRIWDLNDKSRTNATSEKGQGQCSFDYLAKFYKLELENLAQKDENTAIKNNHNFSSWKELKSRRKRNCSDSSASTSSDFSDVSIPKRVKLASHQNNVNISILGIDHEVRQKIGDISLAEELPTEMMKKYNEFCSMNSDFDTTPPASPVSNQSDKESPVFNQFGGNELETPSTSYDGQLSAKKSILFDKFNEDLTCTICYEIFVHPVGLKCGHLFCNFCLIQSMKSKKDCPSCREPIPEKPNKQVSVLTVLELH